MGCWPSALVSVWSGWWAGEWNTETWVIMMKAATCTIHCIMHWTWNISFKLWTPINICYLFYNFQKAIWTLIIQVLKQVMLTFYSHKIRLKEDHGYEYTLSAVKPYRTMTFNFALYFYLMKYFHTYIYIHICFIFCYIFVFILFQQTFN